MLELRVLGPVSVKRADGSDVAAILAQPKRLALAAYLAAPPPHGGRCFHRKDTLVGMFWPDLDQARARAALRNSLYFLRRCLGADTLRSRGDEGVGLDPDKVWCDLDAFDVAVRTRDHSTAFQLYRGTMLEGVFVSAAQPFEEWLDSQRLRRSTEAQEAAAQAARRHAAAGRLGEALTWARRARAMAPLNEDAARLLIALRCLNGDRAGAIDEYARFASLLMTEHDVEPGPETQRLFEAVRAPDSDLSAFSSAIAELPLRPPPSRRPTPLTVTSRQSYYDRQILEAFVQKRLGLARRRGERVAVLFVRMQQDVASDSEMGAGLASTVVEGVRAADVVARYTSETVAVMPAEEGGADVNALVGRLRAHINRSTRTAVAIADGAALTINVAWLDPMRSDSAPELLGEALT